MSNSKQQSDNDGAQQCNPLMGVYVTAVLPPNRKSHIRRTGSVGVAIYEEGVVQGLGGSYVEFDGGIIVVDGKQHAPLNVSNDTTARVIKDEMIPPPAYDDDGTKAVDGASIEPYHLTLTPWEFNNLVCSGCRPEKGFSGLHTVRFHSVEEDAIAHIPTGHNGFLIGIDLSAFSNVTKIGWSFLSGCTSLAAVDLSAFSNVTEIGASFLLGCTSLVAVDLSALSNVTEIGECFLSGCTSLAAVDLSGFSNVTEIRKSFLSGCTSLAAVDLSAFSNVTVIYDSFLSGCTSLAAVDLRAFSNVTEIRGSFLSGCTSLAAVDLSPFSSVTQIGSSFLSGCTSLAAVDLSPFTNVTRIYGYFLLGCNSLAAVDLSPFNNFTSGNMGEPFDPMRGGTSSISRPAPSTFRLA